jgi:hypothetical protein
VSVLLLGLKLQGVALERQAKMLASPNEETVDVRGLESRNQVPAPSLKEVWETKAGKC